MNDTLLLKPWRVHLPQVVQALKAHQQQHLLMLNAHAAIFHLNERLETLTLLKLYEQFFPTHYRKSKAPTALLHPTGYSRKELEFFQLVNARLFPIAEMWWDAEAAERWPYIPLETAALEANEMAEWEPFWQFIYTLANPEMFAHAPDLDWNDIAAQLLPPNATLPLCVTYAGQVQVDSRRFFQQAAAWSPKLAQMRVLFDYAHWDTGHPFLDVDQEILGYSELPEWSADNIEWLTQDWQAAQTKLAHICAIRGWLEAKPKRIARLIEIWNDCATTNRPTPTDERLPLEDKVDHDDENHDGAAPPGAG